MSWIVLFGAASAVLLIGVGLAFLIYWLIGSDKNE